MTSAKPPGPGLRDWALLAVSMTFVAIGLFLLRKEPRAALMPLTFFGSCAAVFAINIHRKLRRRRFTATSVQVAGGVKLHRSGGRMLLLAGLVAVPGIAIFITPAPLLIRLCGGVMLAASAWLIFAVLTGRIARVFLRFDPLGLTFGYGSDEVLVPWNAVVDVSEFDIADNACVGVTISDFAALLVKPEERREQILRAYMRHFSLSGGRFVLMAAHFNVPAENLAGAIRHYAQDASARADLVPHRALPQSRGA